MAERPFPDRGKMENRSIMKMGSSLRKTENLSKSGFTSPRLSCKIEKE